MAPRLIVCKNSKFPLLNFATDLDVLQAVYDEIMRLRVAGKKTKAQRAQAQSEVIDFDTFEFIEVTPYRESHKRLALHIGLSLTDTRWVFDRYQVPAICPRPINNGELGAVDIYIRVHGDWTLVNHYDIDISRVYDGRPLVNPARMMWQKTVKWMNLVRPYAWHWLEEYQKSSCAESGINKKRDLEAFKLDFIE